MATGIIAIIQLILQIALPVIQHILTWSDEKKAKVLLLTKDVDHANSPESITSMFDAINRL